MNIIPYSCPRSAYSTCRLLTLTSAPLQQAACAARVYSHLLFTPAGSFSTDDQLRLFWFGPAPVHTCCSHLLFTPAAVHTCCPHLLFAPAVYTCCSHLLFTYAVHTCCSHLLFTYAVHTCCSHLLFAPAVYTCCSHLLFTYAVHTCCLHMLFTPAVHTCIGAGVAVLVDRGGVVLRLVVCGGVLVVSCVVLFSLHVYMCDLFLFTPVSLHTCCVILHIRSTPVVFLRGKSAQRKKNPESRFLLAHFMNPCT